MIALENMRRVNEVGNPVPNVSDWAWAPAVSDLGAIDESFRIEATGGNTTSKKTFSTQMDHGENK